jgi:hypothetical protein
MVIVVAFQKLEAAPDPARSALGESGGGSIAKPSTAGRLAVGKRLLLPQNNLKNRSSHGHGREFLCTVCLFDARTYEPSAQFPGHEGLIRAVKFSLDSRRLASCSSDRTVRLWQIDGGRCQVLGGHSDKVFAVAFRRDGRRPESAGRDRAVWLWDLTRGEEAAQLPGHTDYVWSLAFSPDGATLVSGSGDFTVRLWDTSLSKVRYQARRETEALRPEAERLVGSLWRQKNDPAGVVAALRADGSLSEPLRHAALREVLRRASPPESGN